jgi:hypothetical protein
MVRVNTLDDEVLKAMASAGCHVIRVGIESGSEWLRRNVLKRPMTNQQIIDALDIAQKYGIQAGAFAMIGMPHETPEMVEETMALLRRCHLNQLQLSIFYPLPGTDLYDECKSNGWLTDEKSLSYFETSVLNLPTITREQILYYYKTCYQEFLDSAAAKETYGLYDFLSNLKSAEIETPDPDFVKITMFEQGQPRRFVIQAHPPSTITYRDIEIPENVVLDFDVIMAPHTYEMEGGGATFIIKVNGKKAFKKRLNPKRRKKDRGWHDARIDLRRFGGKKIDITFITESSDNRNCVAGWGRPVIQDKDAVPGPPPASLPYN